ncbi:MAG: hypothetical protein ACXVEF_15940 [Polyangiales bacterium]
MLRRVAFVLACFPIVLFGCVTGGEGDIDPSIALSKDSAVALDDADEEPESGSTDAPPPAETGDDTGTSSETATEPDSEPPADAIFPPDDAGCTPSCTTCGADDGCGGTCKTGSCGAGETCAGGTCIAPTKSYLSPGDYAFGSAWAKGITWTIGSETPSKIFYTVDGSTPGAGSASKASPADLFIGTSGTVIKWYADNGAKEPTVHSFTANIDSAGQTAYGWIVDKVDLASKGPVIVVSPGAVIDGSAAYQGWNSSGCPGCRMQIVYGISGTYAGCLYDWSPGAWPGASGTGTIKVTAPSTAGTYKLEVTYTLQTSCANGLAVAPMAHGTAGVATIVVK